MRTGKISENTLKRSVMKNRITSGERLIHGAGVRDNCAVFSYSENEFTALSTHQVILPDAKDSIFYAINRGINNLYAAAAKPEAVQLSLLLPADYEEPELAGLMKEAAAICKKYNMSISGGSTKTDPRIAIPAISVTVIGTRKERELCQAKPGWDVVLSKPVGLAGTAILAKAKEEELCKRYPARYIAEAKNFAREVSVIPEAATAGESFVCRMFAVSEGGIFAALWEAADLAGVGLDIDLKRIPIRQESVEICDFLGINPYELMSDGCIMIMTPEGEKLVETLQEKSIPAALIGRTTGENGKIIHNEDEVRYVDKPAADSIYYLLK